MHATALGWRLAASPELYVELAGGDPAAQHQRLCLSAPKLLAPGVSLAHLASLIRGAAPASFGLVSPGAMVGALRALSGAVRAQQAEAARAQPAAAAAAPLTGALASIGDLQRVGPAMLQAAKAKMDVVFQAHKVAKEDPAFVYDKRVAFTAAAESSDWD